MLITVKNTNCSYCNEETKQDLNKTNEVIFIDHEQNVWHYKCWQKRQADKRYNLIHHGMLE